MRSDSAQFCSPLRTQSAQTQTKINDQISTLSITFVVALLDQQRKGVAHDRPKLHPLVKSTSKDPSDHRKRGLEVSGVETEPRQQGPNLEKEKKQTNYNRFNSRNIQCISDLISPKIIVGLVGSIT